MKSNTAFQDLKRRELIENSTITTKITRTKTEKTERIIPERIIPDPATMIEESNNKPQRRT